MATVPEMAPSVPVAVMIFVKGKLHRYIFTNSAGEAMVRADEALNEVLASSDFKDEGLSYDDVEAVIYQAVRSRRAQITIGDVWNVRS